MITKGTLYLTYDTSVKKIMLKSATLGGMFLEAKDIVEKRKYDKSLLKARFVYTTFLAPVPQYARNYSSMDFVLYDCTKERR